MWQVAQLSLKRFRSLRSVLWVNFFPSVCTNGRTQHVRKVSSLTMLQKLYVPVFYSKYQRCKILTHVSKTSATIELVNPAWRGVEGRLCRCRRSSGWHQQNYRGVSRVSGFHGSRDSRVPVGKVEWTLVRLSLNNSKRNTGTTDLQSRVLTAFGQ